MTPAQRVLQELIDEAANRKINGWISERVRYAQERALVKALRKVEEAEERAVVNLRHWDSTEPRPSLESNVKRYLRCENGR